MAKKLQGLKRRRTKRRADWKKLANKEVCSLAATISTKPKTKKTKEATEAQRSFRRGLCINPVDVPTRVGRLAPWGGAMGPSR